MAPSTPLDEFTAWFQIIVFFSGRVFVCNIIWGSIHTHDFSLFYILFFIAPISRVAIVFGKTTHIVYLLTSIAVPSSGKGTNLLSIWNADSPRSQNQKDAQGIGYRSSKGNAHLSDSTWRGHILRHPKRLWKHYNYWSRRRNQQSLCTLSPSHGTKGRKNRIRGHHRNHRKIRNSNRLPSPFGNPHSKRTGRPKTHYLWWTVTKLYFCARHICVDTFEKH